MRKEKEMSSVEDTLRDREKKYGGSFLEQSQIAQRLKETIRQSPNWKAMRVDMREALDMVCTKMSRICYGDPMEVDSWHDIQGYTRLIEEEIVKNMGSVEDTKVEKFLKTLSSDERKEIVKWMTNDAQTQ